MIANELRMGNVVTFNDNEELIVTSIFEKGIHDKNYNGYDYGDLRPIKITNEWLLRFGFIECSGKYGEYFKCSKLDGFRIWFFENEYTNCWQIGRKDYDKDDTVFIHGNVKTIHQLQNLYFALTGEELKTK